MQVPGGGHTFFPPMIVAIFIHRFSAFLMLLSIHYSNRVKIFTVIHHLLTFFAVTTDHAYNCLYSAYTRFDNSRLREEKRIVPFALIWYIIDLSSCLHSSPQTHSTSHSPVLVVRTLLGSNRCTHGHSDWSRCSVQGGYAWTYSHTHSESSMCPRYTSIPHGSKHATYASLDNVLSRLY